MAAWAMAMVAALLAVEARAETWPASHGPDGLPGMYRVITAEPLTSREVSLASSAGLGVTRGVVCSSDTHVRLTGALAASVSATDWLAVSAGLDGRHDRLSCVAAGLDSWTAGRPSAMARARLGVAPGWHAAGQVRLRLAADRGLSVDPTAITIDTLAALSHTPAPRLRVGGNLGFRFDRSSELADRYFMPTRAERISLGVSESHAILIGVGAAYRLGRAEILAEWTWDLHVGDSAPDVRVSPMRVAAGARMSLSRRVAAQLTLEANLGRTPKGLLPDPLSPLESRVTAMLGLQVRARVPAPSWPFGQRRLPDRKPPDPVNDTADDLAPDETPDETPDEVPIGQPEPATLSGRVIDQSGQGVAQIAVEVTVHGETRTALTDARGDFEIRDLAAGSAELRVNAQGFYPVTTGAELDAGHTRTVELSLRSTAQLRGLVRSFRGRAVRATLIITDQDQGQSRTLQNRADGSFEIDVEPGRYRVEITAQGYRPQSRRVTVEDSGVTIINVDMRK